MRVHALIGVPLVGLATTVLASGSGEATTRCYTRYGPHSPPHGCPTVSKTSHTPCTTTITTTTTTTSSASSTVTITTTTTSTVTTALVVPASAGFTPIQSSLPDSTYDGAQGGSPAKRNVLNQSRARRENPLAIKDKEYPTAVTCWKWTPSATCATAKKSATSVTVVSSKILPTVSVSVITSAVTRTSTVTSTSYSTTVYAACATNNFADQIQAPQQPTCYLNGIASSSSSSIQGEDISLKIVDAYSCCVFAITDPHGADYWAFIPQGVNGGASASDACFVITEGETSATCPSQINDSTVLSCKENDQADEYVFGNGYCGAATSVSRSSSSSIP